MEPKTDLVNLSDWLTPGECLAFLGERKIRRTRAQIYKLISAEAVLSRSIKGQLCVFRLDIEQYSKMLANKAIKAKRTKQKRTS